MGFERRCVDKGRGQVGLGWASQGLPRARDKGRRDEGPGQRARAGDKGRSKFTHPPRMSSVCPNHGVGSSLLIAVLYSAVQIIPTSRNSFDRVAPGFAFDGGKLATPCTCADKGSGCAQGIPRGQCPPGLGSKCASGSDVNVRAEGGGGQPCLWWSQGCSIGCPFCLTDPKHPDNNGMHTHSHTHSVRVDRAHAWTCDAPLASSRRFFFVRQECQQRYTHTLYVHFSPMAHLGACRRRTPRGWRPS